jgi:very-short-patch-repair endonuclease
MTVGNGGKETATDPRPGAGRWADDVIMELAGRQHGVVSRSQLLHAGVKSRSVSRLVRRRLLRSIHRGVYQVGPVVAPRMWEMAAVLACGGEAVVSHESAARLVSMPVGPRIVVAGAVDPVDVLVLGHDRGRRPGIRARRLAGLPADERTEIEGIPATTPARTILDLASVVAARRLEQLLAFALREGLARPEELVALLARHPRQAGTRVLRWLLRRDGPLALTRSEAEELFLAIIRSAGLPWPEANVRVLGFEVDFHWPGKRLIVEIDSLAHHGDTRAFERDRRRDAILVAAGYRVIRVTWKQLVRERDQTLARVAAALAV